MSEDRPSTRIVSFGVFGWRSCLPRTAVSHRLYPLMY